MRYLTGSDIKVYTGETPRLLGLAKSCTISLQADGHESASDVNGRARTYISGRTDWEVTVSKLMFYMRHDLMRIGQTYLITLKVDSTDQLSGSVICTQVQTTVQEGNLVKCSVRFKGTGALQ